MYVCKYVCIYVCTQENVSWDFHMFLNVMLYFIVIHKTITMRVVKTTIMRMYQPQSCARLSLLLCVPLSLAVSHTNTPNVCTIYPSLSLTQTRPMYAPSIPRYLSRKHAQCMHHLSLAVSRTNTPNVCTRTLWHIQATRENVGRLLANLEWETQVTWRSNIPPYPAFESAWVILQWELNLSASYSPAFESAWVIDHARLELKRFLQPRVRAWNLSASCSPAFESAWVMVNSVCMRTALQRFLHVSAYPALHESIWRVCVMHMELKLLTCTYTPRIRASNDCAGDFGGYHSMLLIDSDRFLYIYTTYMHTLQAWKIIEKPLCLYWFCQNFW